MRQHAAKPMATALACAALFTCAGASAEWTGSIGYVSEYIFRGIPQKNSSASAGIEYGASGFTVGTWGADVGDGLEVDLYGSYGGEINGFSYGIGFTGYYYTGDFDDTYQEVNLSGGYGFASVDVAVGEYDNFDGPTQDYLYYSLTLEAPFGAYLTAAGFSEDFDGNYLELGYATDVADGLELSVAVIFSDSDLIGDDDENVVFGLTKSFSFKDLLD